MSKEARMNHKRKRPRNRRAECKLCKPWKVNSVRTESADGETWSSHKRREFARRDISDYRAA